MEKAINEAEITRRVKEQVAINIEKNKSTNLGLCVIHKKLRHGIEKEFFSEMALKRIKMEKTISSTSNSDIETSRSIQTQVSINLQNSSLGNIDSPLNESVSNRNSDLNDNTMDIVEEQLENQSPNLETTTINNNERSK